MRHNSLVFLGAIVAYGCGGKVLPTPPPDDPTPAGCSFGSIAEVSGTPLALASVDSGVYFALPVDALANHLYFVSPGESPRLVTNDLVDPDLVVLGSSLGFISRTLDASGRSTSANVEILAPDQSISRVDGLDAATYQINQPSTDGRAIYWLRWYNGHAPTSAGAIGKFENGVVSHADLGAGVTGVFDVVPDSTGYYAGFVTVANDAPVIGRLPVNGVPAMPLASAGSAETPGRVLGVDGDNVIYETASADETDVWSVPKNGGTASKLASDRAHLVDVSLFNHRVFWIESANDSTAIMSFDIRGDGTPRAVATRPRIETFTVDTCGVVYATADASGSEATIYRSNYHSH